jgi:hypothetical protein
MSILIPKSAPLVNVKIIRLAQADVPILENPIGSNRSPEIDAMCAKFGVPLGSYWCALWTSDVWQRAGAQIPPVNDAKGWHPAKAETWHQWAVATGRFTKIPSLGRAVLYGKRKAAPAHHIGCCVCALKPLLLDFEGNTSLSGFSTEGELTGLKPINAAELIGYVSPEPLEVSI